MICRPFSIFPRVGSAPALRYRIVVNGSAVMWRQISRLLSAVSFILQRYVKTTPLLKDLGCEMYIGTGKKSASEVPGRYQGYSNPQLLLIPGIDRAFVPIHSSLF